MGGYPLKLLILEIITKWLPFHALPMHEMAWTTMETSPRALCYHFSKPLTVPLIMLKVIKSKGGLTHLEAVLSVAKLSNH